MRNIILSLCTAAAVQAAPAPVYHVVHTKGEVAISYESRRKLETNALSASFTVNTPTNAYALLSSGDDLLAIGEKTKLSYRNGLFSIYSGIVHVYNDRTNAHSVWKSGGNNISLAGRSYSVLVRGPTIVAAGVHGVYISKQNDIPVEYLLEPNDMSVIDLSSPPQKADMSVRRPCAVPMGLCIEEARRRRESSITRMTIMLFPGTQYETPLYRVVSRNPGTNVFLLSPHADEVSAPIAARNAYDTAITRGSITIIPYPVMPAYRATQRFHLEDLNRQFYLSEKEDKKRTDIDILASKYKSLLREYRVHLVVAMHEGYDLFSINEKQFGQSIVYDNPALAAQVRTLLARLNGRIELSEIHFLEKYFPMPTTLTYYAWKNGMDSYCIELLSGITLSVKVRIQSAMFHELLKMYRVCE